MAKVRESLENLIRWLTIRILPPVAGYEISSDYWYGKPFHDIEPPDPDKDAYLQYLIRGKRVRLALAEGDTYVNPRSTDSGGSGSGDRCAVFTRSGDKFYVENLCSDGDSLLFLDNEPLPRNQKTELRAGDVIRLNNDVEMEFFHPARRRAHTRLNDGAT